MIPDRSELKNGNIVEVDTIEIQINNNDHNKYLTATIDYAEYDNNQELSDEDYNELNEYDDLIIDLIDHLEL